MAGIGIVLKHTLNRMTSRVARGRSGPFALVRHVGRKSGKPYETPIIVRPIDRGFMIELTYGDQVDWYRNVVAAGVCGILFHGVEHRITLLEATDAATGIAAFTPAQQRILRLLKRRHFVKFLEGQAAAAEIRTVLPEGSRNAQSRGPHGWSIGS